MSSQKGIGFCQQSEVLRNMSTPFYYLLVKLFAIALTISTFLCFGVNTVGINP